MKVAPFSNTVSNQTGQECACFSEHQRDTFLTMKSTYNVLHDVKQS